MKERQYADEAVAGLHGKDLGERVHVCEQVCVCEDHALGLTGAAAGEDDGRWCGRGPVGSAETPAKPGGWEDARPSQRRDFSNGRDLAPKVFEKDHVGRRVQARLVEEASRRDHGANVAPVSYTHLTLPTSDLV